MPVFQRKSEDEKAERQAQKQSEQEAKAREKLRKAFFSSPAGHAREAFEAGAHVFQYETDVRSMKAVVRPIGMGSSAIGKDNVVRGRFGQGPVATLNAVCDEGWELVNGSFVFLETGQESRDKFLASGQQIAISGRVIGYYLFKRNEANKTTLPDPWEAPADEASALAAEVE